MTFTRRVNFTAFQFNRTPHLTEGKVHEQLSIDVPELRVYDLMLTEKPNREDPFLDPEPVLVLVQLRFDQDGERSNVVHELRSGEWLMEDVFDECGWRVVTSDELMEIIS